MTPKIMIMGVGNVLLSDEGLGVHFINDLKQEGVPDNVELIEGGTAGLELVHLIQDVDFLFVVDAVNAKTDPGALFRFKPDDMQVFPSSFELSFHQVGILEVLTTASIFGKVPETVIYGVQPKSLDWGMELSNEIKTALGRVKISLLEEVRQINETYKAS